MKTVERIFNDILNQLKKQDLSTYYHGANSAPKLSLKEECAATSHIVVNIAGVLGNPFYTYDGLVYVFNDSYWQSITDIDLKVFLKESYLRLTENNVKSTQYDTMEGLVKQFPYTALQRKAISNPTLINYQNGILDISKDQLLSHSPKEFFRYMLPYDYTPTADCPMFMKYLNRVLPDLSCQKVLAEYIGWLFVSNLKLEKVLFLYGSGCNGKSVFVEIVEALLGKENISHESLSDMCGENGDRSRANLGGRLLNTCSDVAPNAFSGDIFKRIASGEPISSRQLYKDVSTLTDYAKMVFCLNELPKTHDSSGGYYRRFLIVPFNAKLSKSEIDPKLAEKIITSELPGIMNWVLKGRERLIKNQQFTDSSVCNQALDEYRYGGKIKNKIRLWLPK